MIAVKTLKNPSISDKPRELEKIFWPIFIWNFSYNVINVSESNLFHGFQVSEYDFLNSYFRLKTG